MRWEEIEDSFQALCTEEHRQGILAAVPLARVHLLPEQGAYLQGRLAHLQTEPATITAVSLAMAYRPEEIRAVPAEWTGKNPQGSHWEDYSAAYHDLNRSLNRVSRALAEGFGGLAEAATLDGIAGQVRHVSDYFPMCVSHRAVAEAARLGWRGLHGLIVTPEFGAALRLASVFLPARVEAPPRPTGACGSCRTCLDVCPVLRKGARLADQGAYREMCRRRIDLLGLSADVCGICVRACWEACSVGAAMA